MPDSPSIDLLDPSGTAAKPGQAACSCGAVRLALDAPPVIQFYCHCNDCRDVHQAPFVGIALFPAASVRMLAGEPAPFVLHTLERFRCLACDTHMGARLPEQGLIGLKGGLLPTGMFQPAFHIHCRHAVAPIRDGLPHYDALPPEFGGSNTRAPW